MKQTEKQNFDSHCPKCHHLMEVNESLAELFCSNCETRSPKISLKTPEEREEEYQHIMDKVKSYKIKKSVTFDLKENIHELDELQPLEMKSRSFTFQSEDVQEYNSSDDEQEQRLKEHEFQLREAIRMHNHDLKAQQKVIVGSGFTFDMTDFFKFKKKELSHDESQSLFKSISGSRLAWIILLYTICSSALIPGWIMNIKATKFLRQCWRFFMQALMVIPFVLHQYRVASPENKEKYTLRYILQSENIIKPFMSSLSACLWFLFILSSFQWTYVCHGIVLGNLSNFFLSLNRSVNKHNHDLESGGQILVMVGVFLVIHDSLSVSPDQFDQETYNYLNTFFLRRTWWERLGGDIIAIFTSFMMSQFSKYTSDLRNYYPPFLSMLLVNIFNVINLTLISFFFNGTSFDLDPFWGIFSVFTDIHFISFMYMAIVLAFGQMVSVVLITKMFPDPIIPALAMTLQPFLACFFIDLTNIQSLPGNFCMVGFILILPGMFLVIVGQKMYQKQKSHELQSDDRVKHLLDEIRELKETMKERQTHMFIKQHKRLGSNSTFHLKDDHIKVPNH